MKKLGLLRNPGRVRKGVAVVSAVAALAALPAGVAFAGGGGGKSDGNGGGEMAAQVSWAYQDSNDGAFGSAGDLGSVYRAFGQMGVTMLPGGVGHAQQALSEANANCLARFNEAHPDQLNQGQCRVVGVGVMTGSNKQFSGEVHHLKSDWLQSWASMVQGRVYSNHGVQYSTADPFFDQPGTSVNSLVDGYTGDSVSTVVIALNQYEPKPADVPPAPPAKTVERGTSADSMVNHTVIASGTGVNGKQFVFRDAIAANGQRYTVNNQRVVDATTGEDLSGRFAFNTANGSTPAGDTATATWKGGSIPDNHTWRYELDVTVHGPETSGVRDDGSVYWKGFSTEADQRTPPGEFPTWKPDPDKSWVFQDPASGRWRAVIDPSKSNTTGADGHTFLDGDQVGAVVNGTVDPNLIEAPRAFKLADDWGAASYLVGQAGGVGAVRVYEADAEAGPDGHYRRSSVADIINQGRDVTAQFDITMSASGAVASAKPSYLAKLKGMGRPLQVTLFTPFGVNFAHGKGAEQVRKDHGKRPGDELTFCSPSAGQLTRGFVPTGDKADTAGPGPIRPTQPDPGDAGPSPEFINKGSETVNDQEAPTNEPRICGYVPPVKKDVVSESSQGGDQSSVDGKVVFPGQKLEYRLQTEPQLPADLAYQPTQVAVTDAYSRYLDVDKQTLEITDLTTGGFVPKSQYASQWDDAAHAVRLVFSDAYVRANWRPGLHPRIIVRFEGTVDKSAPADTKVDNQWGLTLNNSLTPSNKVVNLPPDPKPDKQVTQKDPSVIIDGRTALLGDKLYYRVGIDARGLDQAAYRVQRLGVIDDYDQEHLKVDEAGIQVLDDSGADVTAKLNIQVKDGIVYAFFRTVDTLVPATGETIKGDPQPGDLKAYAGRKLDPVKDPGIDQRVLGHSYQLVLPVTVISVKDGYTVSNTAKQVSNDRQDVTNTVSNPLKPVNPVKDVVVTVGGGSIDHQKVYFNSQFLYRLDSSVLPAHRAYPKLTDWSIVDKYDKDHDKPTGQWSVYANRDLKAADGSLLAKRGQRIAGKGFDAKAFGGGLFDFEDTGSQLTITASKRYLELASRDVEEQAWSAYVQFTRYKASESVKNWFTETLNGVQRPSNEVETKTPDLVPAISVEKFDQASGPAAGDRNDPQEALEDAKDGTVIVFRITNTGQLPLTGLALHDQTVLGSGTVEGFEYPEGFDQLVLKPGDHVDVTGRLKGVKDGDRHTDRALASGKPVVDCPVLDDDPWDDKPGTQKQGGCGGADVVSQPDDWNGLRPATLALTGSNVLVLFCLGLSLFGASLPPLAFARRRRHRSTEAHHASA
ncbi:putative cell surface protein [Bifidobacterium actinocoloniiforme DSM 22766]|uniref:Putative cell surface protein n=1 Tax=Bifidobacterium actinocoloniiforme DSM 22766 TaxID=1437605 RepID=A0A086YVU9_9BIFI|nr:LPXTG cell wall anchor domain-containing protein [Bifidobacterium actinocoloniiforme]KFI38399.1 putative cell surface protein [Bifidobacterium actinocoloniiforme DSM 22766]